MARTVFSLNSLVGATTALVLSLLGGGSSVAQENQITVFGGAPVSNDWEDVFRDPSNLQFRDASMLGISYGREWPTQAGAFSFGIEAQVVKYFGEQTHFEFNLPAFFHYRPGGFRPLDSLGFGVGLSHATEVPPIEVENKGGSARTLLYWAMEAEFGQEDADTTFFLRLHHRSNGFGLFAEKGGFNALVLGLRHRY